MPEDYRTPSRNIEDYKGLTRSVAQNHARVEASKTKEHKTGNLLEMFMNNKWLLWIIHYFKSRFGPRHPFNTYENSDDKGIYTLNTTKGSDCIKIALVSDWGTDTMESKEIGVAIAKHAPEYTIHLGDTYFVGAPFEIKNNFSPDDSYWPYGTLGSFVLTGNHEMYSNGDSFFRDLLPWMGIFSPSRIPQKTSYFCLENDYWRIIGLDTGYRSVGIPILELLFAKADLRPEVISWLQKDLNLTNDNRGIILLSHHQYISSFDKEFPRASQQLQNIIGSDRPILWFWGHEHRFAMYGKFSSTSGLNAYGRCIGHGGMPTTIIKNKNKARKKRDLILLDNRIRKQIDKTSVGHNGYCLLKLEREKLSIDYYDEENLLVTENWQYNKISRQIEEKGIIYHCSELKI